MANRIVLGNLSGYRLRISKIGFNVLTTGLENCLFDSEYGFTRILAQGEINFATYGSNFSLDLSPYIFGGVLPTLLYYSKPNPTDLFWLSGVSMYGMVHNTTIFSNVVTISRDSLPDLVTYLVVTR